nr:MAG TPA: hypothetical protein [Caudoviricetes sp.]
MIHAAHMPGGLYIRAPVADGRYTTELQGRL